MNLFLYYIKDVKGVKFTNGAEHSILMSSYNYKNRRHGMYINSLIF